MTYTTETRTRWIPLADLTTEDDIAGFGPVTSIHRDETTTYVGNIFGCLRRLHNSTMVELYEGTYRVETGRRISMSSADYRASVLKELAAR